MSARRHPNHRPVATLPPELRRCTVPPGVRAWVQHQLETPVARVERLPGASTTAVHRLRMGDGRDVVLRRYVWPGFLSNEPDAPRRELDVLVHASRHGLAVPHVLAADVSGDDIGDGIPALVMSFLRGHAVVRPDPVRLAEVLAAIHADAGDGVGHDWFPWYADVEPVPPRGAGHPDLWMRAHEVRATAMPAWAPRLIHRDFHPGNVLWWRGTCSGVVDWANGCRGPVGCDVATCRGDLLRHGHPEVADRFQVAWESATGQHHHPYWEVVSVLERGPSGWPPPLLAVAEERLGRALAALG